MTRPTLVLILLASALPAAAQEPPPPLVTTPVGLSLAEAVERSLAASAQLRELEQLRVAAGAELTGARAERLPTADVGGSYIRRSDIVEFLIPQPPGEPPLGFLNLPDNYALSARARLPIYTGGRISSQIEVALESEQAAGLDIEARRRALVLETKAAYWTLVTARDSEKVLREGLTAFDAHLKDARNRERFGLAARNDVLAVQVERQRAELRRLRAENSAEVAVANLARLLQLPPGTTVEPTETLESVPLAGEDPEVLVARALEARPERAGLSARLKRPRPACV